MVKALLVRGDAEGALRELEARSAKGALLVGFGRVEEGLAELDAVIAAAPDYPEPSLQPGLRTRL